MYANLLTLQLVRQSPFVIGVGVSICSTLQAKEYTFLVLLSDLSGSEEKKGYSNPMPARSFD